MKLGILAALAAFACLASPAAAQQAFSPAGSQHGLSVATLQSLTVPSGANYAAVCASGALVYWSTNPAFTPTTSSGQPLQSGSCMSLRGGQALASFRAIGTGATIDVEYFRQ